jgi:hypothetical protein
MEISMCLKRIYMETMQVNGNMCKINKETVINKFIEKFPKVKLETIIKINKYCDEINYDLENGNFEQMELFICSKFLVNKLC